MLGTLSLLDYESFFIPPRLRSFSGEAVFPTHLWLAGVCLNMPTSALESASHLTANLTLCQPDTHRRINTTLVPA